MSADITLVLTALQISKVNQNQAINAIVEVRVAAEINKLHATGFTQFRILLVQWRDTAPQVIQALFEVRQVLLVICARKLPQHFRE